MGKLVKKTCDNCKKKYREIIYFKGKFICRHCLKKVENKLGKISHNKIQTLQKALDKTYEIKGYINRGYIVAYRTFPQILIGHKVKLKLADGKSKK